MHQSDLLGGADYAGDDATHRIFFALWPDSSLRERIAATVVQLEHGNPSGGRRLNADRYHLTLQFLGDYRPLRQSVLDAAITAAEGVHSPAFELALDCAGSFPGARVGWLAPRTMPAALQSLWDSLAVALARTRVQVKSPPAFSPHLTVLRDVRKPLPSTPIEPLHWPVREFVLIDSVSGAHPGYRLLGRWPLRDDLGGT